MAAGTWNFYKRAKRLLGRGAIKFHANDTYVALFRASFTVAKDTANLSVNTLASLSFELPAATGYTAGGKIATNHEFTLSGTNGIFTCSEFIWTGTGGTLGGTDFQFAVMWVSLSGTTQFPLAYVTLSTSPFGVGSGSTITINSGGGRLFEIQ
jgi:hypothetical protein